APLTSVLGPSEMLPATMVPRRVWEAAVRKDRPPPLGESLEVTVLLTSASGPALTMAPPPLEVASAKLPLNVLLVNDSFSARDPVTEAASPPCSALFPVNVELFVVTGPPMVKIAPPEVSSTPGPLEL